MTKEKVPLPLSLLDREEFVEASPLRDEGFELFFEEPGQPLAGKRLVTIKAITPTGVILQLPFEPQINNQVGGDPQDMLGLLKYTRKGYILLWDKQYNTLFCKAWDCWAKGQAQFEGFCCAPHKMYTSPDAPASTLGSGVTTRRTVHGGF